MPREQIGDRDSGWACPNNNNTRHYLFSNSLNGGTESQKLVTESAIVQLALQSVFLIADAFKSRPRASR
jgi:hypothetical protein